MSKPVTVLIVGAGSRGSIYADWMDKVSVPAKVVAVAEPRAERRELLARQHGLAAENVFDRWDAPLERAGKIADAVIITTPDHLHVEPACAYAERGYHMILEKPMAPTADGCRQVAAAVRKAGVMSCIGHVLRYAPYTRKLIEVLRAGAIGQVLDVQHLEPVGYWHQAHSFVRGNWGNQSRSSFMLLSKSCHDLDWLAYVVGSHPRRVSSFGTLSHFKAENAPAGSAQRCLDCPADVEAACPYSAKRVYFAMLERGVKGWPLDVLTTDLTPAGLERALRETPYGQCAYRCDNDVVDHQVVNIEFDGAQTGVFTMTAFSRANMFRQTRIFGTRGEIFTDGRRVEVYDFVTEKVTTYEVAGLEGSQQHAGGDQALLEAFLGAVANNDPARIVTDAEETLATHLAVFAAEQARLEGRVVEIQ